MGVSFHYKMVDNKLIVIIAIVVILLLNQGGTQSNEDVNFCSPGNLAAGVFAEALAICQQRGMAPSFQTVDGSCQLVCVATKADSNLDY